jgi:hypothetical protein
LHSLNHMTLYTLLTGVGTPLDGFLFASEINRRPLLAAFAAPQGWQNSESTAVVVTAT